MKIKDDLYYFEHFINYSERIILDKEIPKLPKRSDRDSKYGCSAAYEAGFDVTKDQAKNDFEVIFRNLYFRVKGIIEATFGCRIIDENFLHILEWGVGDSLHEHVDKRDGESVPTPSGNISRDLSSTIYFNDSYSGGEILFPNQKLKIKPSAGSLITFPTSHHYPHEVIEVTDGNRWTITNFWTIVK